MLQGIALCKGSGGGDCTEPIDSDGREASQMSHGCVFRRYFRGYIQELIKTNQTLVVSEVVAFSHILMVVVLQWVLICPPGCLRALQTQKSKSVWAVESFMAEGDHIVFSFTPGFRDGAGWFFWKWDRAWSLPRWRAWNCRPFSWQPTVP